MPLGAAADRGAPGTPASPGLGSRATTDGSNSGPVTVVPATCVAERGLAVVRACVDCGVALRAPSDGAAARAPRSVARSGDDGDDGDGSASGSGSAGSKKIRDAADVRTVLPRNTPSCLRHCASQSGPGAAQGTCPA